MTAETTAPRHKGGAPKASLARARGKNSASAPDPHHADRFLRLLAAGHPVTFQTFDDSEAHHRSLACTFHGGLEQHARRLADRNAKGAGVFVCINQTDGVGRKAENVTAVRGLVADFDDADHARLERLPEILAGFDPTIIVESSPGRHHCYWLTHEPGELALEEFKPLQQALARWLGADTKVCDLPRVMRLPGFIHRKGEPFQSRVVHEGARLTAEEIRSALRPHLEEFKPMTVRVTLRPEHPQGGEVVELHPYARRALDSATSAILAAAQGERNDTLNREAHGVFGLVKAGSLPESDTRQTLTRAAQGAGLAPEEIDATLDSAWQAAQVRDIPDTRQQGALHRGVHNTEKEAEPHPAPRPLPPSLPPVATFEEEMLPEALRGYVMDVAHRLQVAPEFCAVPALVLLAGLVGHQIRLRPKVHDDWEIALILWGALCGGTGAGKSPAINAMTFPVDAIEADARQRHREALVEFEVEEELAELAKAAAKDKAKKAAKAGNMEGARLALEEVSEAPAPAPPARLVINDATVEKAGELMNQSKHNLTILRDELTGLLAKVEREDGAEERAFYLEAYNGKRHHTVDRIGRGTIFIERCALNMLGGIQPSKLAPIVRGALKGTSNDGLVQRFQLAVWPDAPRNWQWIDRTPDPQAKERYAQTFYRLHGLELQDEEGNPAVWRFTPEAQTLFVQWATEINLRARTEETPPLLAEHMLKMPNTIGALALLFAVIDGDQGEVGTTSTARALAWADLLVTHAQRIYSAATSRDIDGARVILKRRDKLPNPFKAKTVQQRGWQGLDSTEATQAAIDLLVEHGYLTEIETPTGGRPRIDYWWHPDYVPAEEGDA